MPPHNVKKTDPQIRDRLVEALREGNYRKVAAAYAGIHERTLKGWMKTGAHHAAEDVQSPEREIHDAVIEAEAYGEKTLLSKIHAQAGKSWQAAAWILERTRPDRYARREGITLSGGDQPVRIAAEQVLSAEHRESAEQLLTQIAATREDTGGLT